MTTQRRKRPAATTRPGNTRPGNTREEVVNTLLAQELRRHGLPAKEERRGAGAIPDIQIELRIGLVILECKWQGAAAQLSAQLDARLAQYPDAIAIVGVTYPDAIQTADDTGAALAAAELRWRCHGSRGQPTPDKPERAGPAAALAEQLHLLPLELDGLDKVIAAASIIDTALDQAVAPLRQHQRIAQTIAAIITEADQENDRLAALKIACLVLFNALAFQDRLAKVNSEVATVTEARKGGLDGVMRAWQSICDRIDYVPVFDIAGRIAEQLHHGPPPLQQSVLDPLIRVVQDTWEVEGHDLSGRLFHTLLTDAKFTGAYYTSVPAATMLSRLVFDDWPPGLDWRQHKNPAALQVADLACGTGTLLMAVAAEARRRHEAAGGVNAPALHQAMVEQSLHGFDIQLSAIHFAATSLAMLNPEIQFDRMNLYVMPLGVAGGEVSLGSLDFIGTQETPAQFALSPDTMGPAPAPAERVAGAGRRPVDNVRLPDLDLAIMNPPFTRPQLALGRRPAAERKAIQAELSRRLQAQQASAVAGLGAAFIVAAAPKLRPGAGRLALVLPATVGTGASWQPTRALIQRDFALDLVVTSHDPQRWNFSDSTDLSEALLIATRRPERPDGADRRTIFANLWQNPDGVLDALRIAQAIADTAPAPLEGTGAALLAVDGRHVGELLSMPEADLTANPWLGMQFARADVLRWATQLLRNGIINMTNEGYNGYSPIPLCPLQELGRIGPDRRRIIDGFDRTESETAYPFIEGHETDKRQSLAAAPDSYLFPLVKPKGGHTPGYGERLWQQAARLLIAERLRLNTTRVLAMHADRPVLSNVWYSVKTENPDWDQALALWLNSSPGILTRLALRTSTEGSWSGLKKGELAKLPVLNVRALPPAQLTALSNLYHQLAGQEFRRLPEMADCPARAALDNGLAQILNLPNLHPLRRMLASEPTVSNRPL